MRRDDGQENGRDLLTDIHLTGRNGPARQSALAQIEGHWRDIWARSGGSLPRRAGIDASRIAGALPHAFILEKTPHGTARLRIAGRNLTALLGTEARGLPLTTLFSPASRPALQGWIDRCFTTPALVELTVEAPRASMRQPLAGRLLLLPMLDQDGAITRVLGGLPVETPPGQPPLRFDLQEEPTRCEPLRSPTTRGGPIYAQAARSGGHGLSEAERPYLRLVVSNPSA